MSKNQVKPIVHLRWYKGTEILTKQSDGTIQNENATLKLPYQSLEWYNYLKHVRVMGYCKIEVVKVTEFIEGEWKEVPVREEIKAEIEQSFLAVAKKLTPEELRIAKLEAQIAELLGSKTPKEEIKKVAEVKDDELSKAKKKYAALFGKEPHHAMKLDGILDKIAEASN